MITTELPRGAKIYWKRGDSFTTAYFLRIHDMPQYKALTVKHASGETVIKDEEAFTEQQRFENQYASQIAYIRTTGGCSKRGFKKRMAKDMDVKYSTVFLIFRKAKKLGVDLYAAQT